MGEAIAFYTLATLILAFAVLVVSTKDTVHSVLYLVLDFLFVAALYVLLQAEFVAVIQVLVYAGGDDVLAFLPVDKCLDCARELRNRFVEILKEYKNEEGQAPTLSVGIDHPAYQHQISPAPDNVRASLISDLA